MKKVVFVEKIWTILLTSILVLALPWNQVMLCYILLGHGHFFLAYYYQHQAGKIDKLYLLNYLLWFAVLVVWYFSAPDIRALALLTTAWFLLHLSLDEMYLMRFPMRLGESPFHLGRTLELAPAALIYLGSIVDRLFRQAPVDWHYTIWTDRAVTSSLWLMIPYLYMVARGQHKFDGKSLYFLGGGCFLAVISHTSWFAQIPSPKLLGFVIIYHYLSWYIHYFLSLENRSKKQLFIKHVAIANSLVLLAYFCRHGTILEKWFFGLECYYILAILHIVSSTRNSDLQAMLKLPKRA